MSSMTHVSDSEGSNFELTQPTFHALQALRLHFQNYVHLRDLEFLHNEEYYVSILRVLWYIGQRGLAYPLGPSLFFTLWEVGKYTGLQGGPTTIGVRSSEERPLNWAQVTVSGTEERLRLLSLFFPARLEGSGEPSYTIVMSLLDLMVGDPNRCEVPNCILYREVVHNVRRRTSIAVEGEGKLQSLSVQAIQARCRKYLGQSKV
jgi:hypothetical protein